MGIFEKPLKGIPSDFAEDVKLENLNTIDQIEAEIRRLESTIKDDDQGIRRQPDMSSSAMVATLAKLKEKLVGLKKSE